MLHEREQVLCGSPITRLRLSNIIPHFPAEKQGIFLNLKKIADIDVLPPPIRPKSGPSRTIPRNSSKGGAVFVFSP
jgi:hypothetical protein